VAADVLFAPRYYPKLQCCVPFTPVTGPKLLVVPGPLQGLGVKALAKTLITLTGGWQCNHARQ